VPSSAGTPASPGVLAGTGWLVEDIDGRDVVERGRSTMTFETAERVVGSTACNRYFAPVTLAGSTLRFGPGGSTRMACAPAVMDQERRFFEALGAVRTYRLEGGTLQLLDEAGRVVLRLTRAPGAERPGRTTSQMGRSAAVTVPPGGRLGMAGA
jgi:putative lipoprotein